MRTILLSILLLGSVEVLAQALSIRLEKQSLPFAIGVQSFAVASYDQYLLIVGGRTEGLHKRRPFESFANAGSNRELILFDRSKLQSVHFDVNILDYPYRDQFQSTNMAFWQDGDRLILAGGYGYVVLEPNYRGSSGRGVEYGKADQLDLGGGEVEDVLAGIDHLAAEGLVDPARVGMGGWSYGGYFSGLAATKHSARFKAAVVAAAITDWISFTGTSEIEHENSLVHWKMWPWDDFPRAWDRSPVAHVGSSKTPTLIVHGSSDTRVPPEQATELYRALRHKKVETEVVFYPREGHGLRERAHQIDFATRFLAWFDAHV